MRDNKNISLLNSQSWRNMSQSIATSICNISNTVYSQLHLNAVAKRILPEHTRDALFQLFCDVRTNTPKDQVFFVRHAEALKPHTFTGWLAMLAALLYSTAGFSLAAVGGLALMATVAFSSIFIVVTGGVMFAMFVGTVATTLTFASLGLVAVACGAGTAAAAGYVTVNFWRLVFDKLDKVRQHGLVTSSQQRQQVLPSSSQNTHRSHANSAPQSTFGSPIKSPGFTPLSGGAPGENTHQPTHDKLTTEPAKDPFRKDIGIPDKDVNDIYGRVGSSASSVATDRSDAPGSAFGSAISQGESPFKSSSSTSSGGSTITTGVPAYTSNQGTNDKDISGSFGKAGSQGSQDAKSAAADAQPLGTLFISNKQPKAQSGGQTSTVGRGHSQTGSGKLGSGSSSSMSGGQAVKNTSKPTSDNSMGRSPGQATNDADINDVFGKEGAQSAAADHKTPSGAPSGASQARETSRATNTKSTGNNATIDADLNDGHGRGGSQNGASHRGHIPNQGSHGSSDMSFEAFGGQDIGLQSNFRGPSGQQGPYGSSGPRGSTTMHDSKFVSGGRDAYSS